MGTQAVHQIHGSRLIDPNDPAQRRISILGIGSNDADARIQSIGGWIANEFPKVRVIDVGNYYKFSEGSKNQTISKIAYVEVSNKDVRNMLLDTAWSDSDLKIGWKT